jgi:hypothetical protein
MTEIDAQEIAALYDPDDPATVAVVIGHINELLVTSNADVIESLFEDFATGALEGQPPGTSISLHSSEFACTIVRTNLSASVDVHVVSMETATGTPAVMTFSSDAPHNEYLTSKVIAFSVNPTVPALQQIPAVDVAMVVFENNLHGNGTVATNTTIRLDSSITSLTLRSGSNTLAIAASKVVTFSMPYNIPQYTAAELQCGVAQAECDAQMTEQNTNLTVKVSECELLARGAIFSGRDAVDRCIDELEALRSNATQLHADCAALPAPCEGRGNCTGSEEEQKRGLGRCICDSGWSGAQCDSQRLCRFWDGGTSSWSTTGCRVLNISEDQAAGIGSLLCACDHLTDFALAADIFANPGAFFSSLAMLEINVPIPLSLSEFLTIS